MSSTFDFTQEERPTPPRVQDVVCQVPRAVLRVLRHEEGAKDGLLDLLFGPLPEELRRRSEID